MQTYRLSRLALFSLGLLLCTCVSAQELPIAPEPPVGTRWTVNNDFTDEFDGNELDDGKWFDYHPRWLGRQPAIFLPRTVSVVDGVMQIRNIKLAQDTVVTFFDGSTGSYSIGGGAVVSRKTEAYHGYYEVRMKASDIKMSSTFWMSNPRTSGECPNYSLELDVIETIGGASPGNAGFITNMKSNTHYYQTDCNGNNRVFSQGGQGPIGGDSSEDFHTYGCWWQDENNMIFYVDGEESHRIRANTGGSARPFDRPMHINMVTETYDWQPPPSAADLADDSRNTTYYDFIHSFKMFGVDEPEPVIVNDGNLVVNPSFETGTFQGWTGWGGSPREVITDADAPDGDHVVHIVGGGAPEQIVALEANTEYILGATARVPSGRVTLGVKPSTENTNLGAVVFDEDAWVRKEFTFNTGNVTEVKFFFFAQTGGDEGFADSFTLERVGGPVDPEPVTPALLLNESFSFANLPQVTTSSTAVDMRFLFKANETRDVRLRITDESGALVGEEVIYSALPGYGHKALSMPLPAGLTDGELLTLEGALLPVGGGDDDMLESGRLLMRVNGGTTSTNDRQLEQLSFYPNPATDQIRIQGVRTGTAYSVMDVDGRKVLTGQLPDGGIVPLRELPAGLYFIMVEDRAMGRVVKQ